MYNSSQECINLTFAKWCCIFTEGLKVKVSLIKELIAIRDGQLICEMDQEVLLAILQDTCVT